MTCWQKEDARNYFSRQLDAPLQFKGVRFESKVFNAFLDKMTKRGSAKRRGYRSITGQVIRILKIAHVVELEHWVDDDLALLDMANKQIIDRLAEAMADKTVTKWSASSQYSNLCTFKAVLLAFVDWTAVVVNNTAMNESTATRLGRKNHRGELEWYSVRTVERKLEIAKISLKTCFSEAIEPVNKGVCDCGCVICCPTTNGLRTVPTVCMSYGRVGRKTGAQDHQMDFQKALESGRLFLPVETAAIYDQATKLFLSTLHIIQDSWLEYARAYKDNTPEADYERIPLELAHRKVCGTAPDEPYAGKSLRGSHRL